LFFRSFWELKGKRGAPESGANGARSEKGASVEKKRKKKAGESGCVSKTMRVKPVLKTGEGGTFRKEKRKESCRKNEQLDAV